MRVSLPLVCPPAVFDRCRALLTWQSCPAGPGSDLLAQVLPGGRIAEMTGDVDQDGVEEGRKLLRMDLQVVEVSGEVLDAGLSHALPDPAQQGGPLVAAEVEAAALSQVF